MHFVGLSISASHPGPQVELDYWKARVANLEGVFEQVLSFPFVYVVYFETLQNKKHGPSMFVVLHLSLC